MWSKTQESVNEENIQATLEYCIAKSNLEMWYLIIEQVQNNVYVLL